MSYIHSQLWHLDTAEEACATYGLLTMKVKSQRVLCPNVQRQP